MDKNKMNDALRTILERLRYPIEVVLVCVRWYAAYPLSLRQIEEMMAEFGVVVDQDRDRFLLWCFVGTTARSARAGAWRKLTSGSTATGSTCAGRWTAPATRSTFCCPRTV